MVHSRKCFPVRMRLTGPPAATSSMIPDSAQRGYLGAGRHAEARHRLASPAEPRATLAIAEQELKEATLRSPFYGGVTRRMAHPGEYLHVGAPVLAGVRTDRVRLRLEVPGRLASRVEPDQPLRFPLDGRVEHRGYGRRGHLLDRSPDNLLLHQRVLPPREPFGQHRVLEPHLVTRVSAEKAAAWDFTGAAAALAEQSSPVDAKRRRPAPGRTGIDGCWVRPRASPCCCWPQPWAGRCGVRGRTRRRLRRPPRRRRRSAAPWC